MFFLFRSAPNEFFLSVMSRSRWRPSGWKRHSRHHQVAERRGCAGALHLWLWKPLSAVFARHTLVAFQCFLTLFTNTRLSRRFRRCRGRMLCGRGRHCPGRGLLRLPLHRRAVGRCPCVSIIAGPSVTRELARHMTFASIASLVYDRHLRSCCCGGVLEVRVGCTSSQDTRHKFVASHLFGIILS